MVCYHLITKQMHQPVIHCGRTFLKKTVGMPVIAYTIDHFAARHIAFQKFVQRLNILLQIGIDCHHSIRILSGRHHAGQDSALMAIIACKTDHREKCVLCCNPVQEKKRAVFTPVIDEHYLAVLSDFSRLGKPAQFIPQHLCRFLDNLFFVITRHYQI